MEAVEERVGAGAVVSLVHVLATHRTRHSL